MQELFIFHCAVSPSNQSMCRNEMVVSPSFEGITPGLYTEATAEWALPKGR